jgi:hypothetical protein
MQLISVSARKQLQPFVGRHWQVLATQGNLARTKTKAALSGRLISCALLGIQCRRHAAAGAM